MRRKMDLDSLAVMQACFVHVKWITSVTLMMCADYDFKNTFLCD